MLLNIKCVFWFSLQLSSEIFLILRRINQDIIRNVYWSSCKLHIILCKVLMLLEFSRQIFEKYFNIKFDENTPSGSRVVPYGRTDGQTDMKKLTDFFRNFAKAPKIEWIGDHNINYATITSITRKRVTCFGFYIKVIIRDRYENVMSVNDDEDAFFFWS